MISEQEKRKRQAVVLRCRRIKALMEGRKLSRDDAAKVVDGLEDYKLFARAAVLAGQSQNEDACYLAKEMSDYAAKALKTAADAFCGNNKEQGK